MLAPSRITDPVRTRKPQRSEPPLLSLEGSRPRRVRVGAKGKALESGSRHRVAAASESVGDFLIGEHAGALDLRPPGAHDRPGIQAVFPPDTRATAPAGASKNPLVKAFGRHIRQVFDLTAGLGADAYRLAEAGYRVRAFERDPVVFSVLESGWLRACRERRVSSEVIERLSFAQGEGGEQIATIDDLDVGVYIDPMYPPPKRKSAKPKRELQVLRALLGEQTDAGALVAMARERAARVVVKRPHHADALLAGANHQIETKLVRFDVYLNPKRMGERG